MENFSDDDDFGYYSDDELEPYPQRPEDLNTLNYYLSKLNVCYDDVYGWVFQYSQRNDRLLQILDEFFDLDSWSALEMIDPSD